MFFNSSVDSNQVTKLQITIYLMLLILALVELIGITGIIQPPHKSLSLYFSGRQTFLACALMGSFLMHNWIRPSNFEFIITVVLGIFFELVQSHFLGGIQKLFSTLYIGGGLGFSSLLVLTIKLFFNKTEKINEKSLIVFLAGMALCLFVIISETFLNLTAKLHPNTYDIALYSIENTLGIQPSFLIGRLFQSSELIKTISITVYGSLPIAVSFLYAIQINNLKLCQVDILITFLTTAAIGFLFYHLYPAIGPRNAFGSYFPNTPPLISQYTSITPINPLLWRNAMPSLHTAWVLLLWWNSRNTSRWIRFILGFFTFFTLLATLGMGEHYLLDLVVAVPFAVFIQGLCTSKVSIKFIERQNAIGSGLLLTSAWILLLRVIPIHIWSFYISWSSIIITVIISFTLESKLAHISNRQEFHKLELKEKRIGRKKFSLN